MRLALTVSLVPQAAAGPFMFHGDLEIACSKAAELGYHAVEIFPPSAEDIDPRALRHILHRNRLELAAVGTGAGWLVHQLSLTSPDSAVRHRALQFVSGIVDFAGAFSAPAIIGSMQGRVTEGVTRDAALGWLGEALEQLGPRAHAYGVPLLIEPLNRYESNLLNTLEQTRAFLAPLRTRNIRILADLFHMNIEEKSIPESLTQSLRQIGHVHFADSNRRAVGFGHTNVREAVNVLRELEYEGFLSAEVLPLPSSAEAAQQTARAFREFFPQC